MIELTPSERVQITVALPEESSATSGWRNSGLVAEMSTGDAKAPVPDRIAPLTTAWSVLERPGQATIASPASFIFRSVSTGPTTSRADEISAGGEEKLPPAG